MSKVFDHAPRGKEHETDCMPRMGPLPLLVAGKQKETSPASLFKKPCLE